MNKKGFFLLFVSFYFFTKADVFPKDGSKVHYRDVYFEEQPVNKASKFELVVSLDSNLNISSKQIVKTKSDFPAFWVKALKWGQTYFWKVNYYDSNGQYLSSSVKHRFTIVNISSANFDEVKLKVNKKATNRSAIKLVAIDYTRSIFNNKAEALWTLPNIDGLIDESTQIRDIKITKDKTITLLANSQPIEMDFSGNILWKITNPTILESDTITFHHEFKKDKDGNFWVLGKKPVYKRLKRKPNVDLNNGSLNPPNDSAQIKKIEGDVLLKFNESGKLLWSWDANEYIKNEDLESNRLPNAMPNYNVHANAFSLDSKLEKVYLGFRDLSRIIKIDINSKKVECSYGEKYPSGEARYGDKLFKSQHDATITSRKTILLLNNNGARSPGLSSVLEIRENPKPTDSLLVWKFELDFDSLTNGKSFKGGNIVELENGNLLVCAGELNRIFEVSKDKEVVWDVFLYSKGKGDTTLQAFPQYRASSVNEITLPHFLFSIKGFLKEKNLCSFSLNMTNTGNCKDLYEIEINDEQNKILFSTTTKTVLPQTSLSTSIKFNVLPSSKAKLTIRSKNASNIFKTLDL